MNAAHRLVALLILAVVFVAPALPATGAAATIEVDETADELNNDGDCSLREAIRAANLDSAVDGCPAGSGADTIQLPAGAYALALSGKGEDAAASGDLDITEDLTLVGAGAAVTSVDAMALDRVFQILGPATVAMSNLTIRGGDPRVGGSAGPAYSGGGIALDSASQLTLEHVSIEGNAAYNGGGLYNNGGHLTLTASAVLGNSADYAGGIYSAGNLTLQQSTVDGNSAAYYAAGIHSGALLDVSASTISHNHAGTNGGGLYVTTGTVTVTNSTISDNRVDGYMGGGVWVYYQAATSVTLLNTTIAGNWAGSGVYTYHEGAAGTLPDPIVFFHNTLLDSNLPGNCGRSLNAPLMGSGGYNLESGDTCNLHSTGDQINTPPAIGPLVNNGGPTLTHILQADSPAIDAANDAACPTADQRGIARPLDGDDDGQAHCDVGAVEIIASAPLLSGVSATSPIDEGSSATVSGQMGANPAAGALTLQVDWGDGSGDSYSYPADTASFAEDHRYLDDGSYPVTVTLSNSSGAASPVQLTVVVANVAPTVDAGPDRQLQAGSDLLLNASFDDPGADSHTASVNWGDGQIAPATVSGHTVSASHRYDDAGVYQVTVTVADDGNASGEDSFLLTVTTEAPRFPLFLPTVRRAR